MQSLPRARSTDSTRDVSVGSAAPKRPTIAAERQVYKLSLPIDGWLTHNYKLEGSKWTTFARCQSRIR